MKKLVLAIFFISLFVPAIKAEEVNACFKIGKLEINTPIKKNLEVVALYDIWHSEGLLGGETKIMQYKKINLNFGAVSSFLGKGTPYLSLDLDFDEVKPNLTNIGIWIGRDFNLNEYRGGVKASKKIW